MLSTRSVRPDTRMDSVEDALAALREGRPVVVVDDESRENEGDLIFPAATATTEQLAFAIRHSTGIICAPMTAQELDRLGIPMMTFMARIGPLSSQLLLLSAMSMHMVSPASMGT